MEKTFRVKFAGASGSTAGSIYRREIFGNNTSCVLVQIADKDILLDLGTGCLSLIPYFEEKVKKDIKPLGTDILISHYHYDHIEGFIFFRTLFDGRKHRIFGQKKNGKSIKEIFSDYLKPPFSPIELSIFEKNIEFIDIQPNEKFSLGEGIWVETAETNHPLGCTAYKISYEGKSLVYMLDHEHGTEKDAILEDFARNCDVLIYDGTYVQLEYSTGKYVGWGHSTCMEGVLFAKRANVKNIILSHHGQWKKDVQLLRISEELKKLFSNAYLASEGMLFDIIENEVEKTENLVHHFVDSLDYKELMEISMSFSTERDINRLLEKILHEAMRITNCDGGTIYIYNGEELEFKIINNYSMNLFKGHNGEPVELPPVPLTEHNVCSYAAMHKKSINVKDVYKEKRFDFTGTKTYDNITKYHTKSLLVHPLVNNKNELIGVMQLINSLDKKGNVIEFDDAIEEVIAYLASHAAISLTNAIYVNEIESLVSSIIEVITTAIDQRSPFTSNHTKNVAKYTSFFVDFINSLPEDDPFPKRFTEDEKKQLVMAARVHDVGKISTPENIINKPTRFGNHEEIVLLRLNWLEKNSMVQFYEGKITEKENKIMQKKIKDAKMVLENINKKAFLDEESLEDAERILSYYFIDENNHKIAFFSQYEAECLKIVRGTFTELERNIMEDHVVKTKELLDKIPFSKEYKRVPEFTSQHHETIDGMGYPLGLKGEEISLESRMLTLLDIFEALTAKDRPYKDTISIEKAFEILHSMVKNEKIDEMLYNYLKKSGIGKVAAL
ncbi:MAG: HD domain-containing phosphohydrolase [Proteocatella sp.]